MIRVGIGGWIYEPWRGGAFYPKGLPKTQELAHASRHVTTIEINSTYYSTQKPASFRKWADETPDDFVFAVKASRFATNRRILAEAGPSIERFLTSGILELQSKLGPILWQFMPTKKFDLDDFGAFLSQLPRQWDGVKLRHAVEVRHESFVSPAFIALARNFEIAVVVADSEKYPLIADRTAGFVYVRLQRARAREKTGYSAPEIKSWADWARKWASGGTAGDLPTLSAAMKSPEASDVFVYMINGAKERAPAAAMALLQKLG